VPIYPDRPGSGSDRPGSDSDREGEEDVGDFLEGMEELFKGLMLASLLSTQRRRRPGRSETFMDMLLRAQAASTSPFGQPPMSSLDPDETSDAGYQARSARAAPARHTGTESRSVAGGAERPAEMHTCAACGRSDFALLKCGRCMQVWYCNRKCQKAHWKHHKAACASD
jgi:hypothetical protein